MELATQITSSVHKSSIIYQILGALTSLILFRFILYLRARHKRYQLFKYYGIPGPEPNLLNGNFDLFSDNNKVLEAYEECHARYGKTYGIFIADEASIISTDLEFNRKVFLDNYACFQERLDMLITGPLSKSLLLTSGETWKTVHRILSPSFSGYKLRESEGLEFLLDTVARLVDYVEKKFSSSQAGKNTIELDILALMKAVALKMISDMAVNLPGVEVKENEVHVLALDKLFKQGCEEATPMVIRAPFSRKLVNFMANNFQFSKTMELINSCISTAIDARLSELRANRWRKSHSDIVGHLSYAHLKGIITRDEVIENCNALLVAGYDTTSTTLTYVFWCLAKYPQVQEKLRQELKIYGSESEYLEQVLNEVMRLYPTVISFVSRKASTTIEIDGITIAQGTRVIYNPWLVHRDPTIWQNPLEFNPDRFNESLVRDLHPCAFAPFGLGARKCIGYRLASLEMKIVVSDLILRYRFGLIAPQDLKLKQYGLFLTKPVNTVLLELTKLNDEVGRAQNLLI